MMKQKTIILLMLLAAAAYASVYVFLSGMGAYQVVKAKPYNMLYEPEGNAYNMQMWCPKGLMWQNDYAEDQQPRQTRSDFPGAFFSPLVRFDRRFVHQTALIIERLPLKGEEQETGEQSAAPLPPAPQPGPPEGAR